MTPFTEKICTPTDYKEQTPNKLKIVITRSEIASDLLLPAVAPCSVASSDESLPGHNLFSLLCFRSLCFFFPIVCVTTGFDSNTRIDDVGTVHKQAPTTKTRIYITLTILKSLNSNNYHLSNFTIKRSEGISLVTRSY